MRRISDEPPLYHKFGPHRTELRADAMPLMPGETAELTVRLTEMGPLTSVRLVATNLDALCTFLRRLGWTDPQKGDGDRDVECLCTRPGRVSPVCSVHNDLRAPEDSGGNRVRSRPIDDSEPDQLGVDRHDT